MSDLAKDTDPDHQSQAEGVSTETPSPDSAPGTMFDAIEAAVGAQDPDPAAETPSDAPQETPEAEPPEQAPPPSEGPETHDETAAGSDAPREDAFGDDPENPDDAFTEEEARALTGKTRRRIKQLLNQRRHFQEEAERARPIFDYIRQNNIPEKDLDVVLGLTAKLANGDYAGFLQGVEPILNLARQFTGEVLPPDLQEQVQKGYVAPAIAKELAQRRNAERLAQQRTQQATQQAQQMEARLHRDRVRQAVNSWEAQTRGSDPDFDAKADLVRTASHALIRQYGEPKSPEQAVQYVRHAYAYANEKLAQMKPKPRPTAPVPDSVTKTTEPPKPEARSFLDVVTQTLGTEGVND